MEVETRKVIEADELGLNRNATAQELVLEFARFAEAQVLRWIQFPRGVLLFLGVPGDESSGWFYVLDRRRGTFYSVDLPCEGQWCTETVCGVGSQAAPTACGSTCTTWSTTARTESTPSGTCCVSAAATTG